MQKINCLLLKTKTYGLSLNGVFVCGEKNPDSFNGVERKHLLLASAL